MSDLNLVRAENLKKRPSENMNFKQNLIAHKLDKLAKLKC